MCFLKNHVFFLFYLFLFFCIALCVVLFFVFGGEKYYVHRGQGVFLSVFFDFRVVLMWCVMIVSMYYYPSYIFFFFKRLYIRFFLKKKICVSEDVLTIIIIIIMYFCLCFCVVWGICKRCFLVFYAMRSIYVVSSLSSSCLYFVRNIF